MKDPAVLFYTSDFLTGVMDLTMEERGQYITLLCAQHQKGDLDEKTIRLLVGSVSVSVLSKFEQLSNGSYRNKRMHNEGVKRRQFVDSRQKNGKLGGRPKNHMDNLVDNLVDNHMGNLPENENENENEAANEVNQRARGLVTIDSKAEAIYQHYPRKVGKKAAIKAIAVALKKTPVKVLEERVRLYSEKVSAWPEEEKQFIPHPATWFNQERWEDNDSEWERKKQKPKHQSEPSAPVTYLN